MTDATDAAFRERMAEAIRFFAAVPDESEARRELAALLAYGPGAVAMFDEVLAELVTDGTVALAARTSLRAFALHVRRTSGRGTVSPAWLDVLPDEGADDETVLRASDPAAPQAVTATDPKPADPAPEGASDQPDGTDDPEAADLPRGTVCGGRYIVEEPIAAGGMSMVYRAIDDRDGSPVALKVLRRTLADDPDMVAAFAREADNAWALRDPGFVKVLAQGWIETQPFLALEYLDGQSLGAAMKGQFATGAPWPVVRRLLQRIGTSIAHAHSLGIVHADLKPGNIFLLRSGEPRILDLGAAQAVHGDAKVDLDRDRDLGGGALTPAYASPEMLFGASAEPRDDIFSLAVIGYELAAGRHPFDRYSADRARHLDIRPKRPRGLPGYAWRTLRRGLALRRDRRPTKMAAFVAGLRQPFPTATVAIGMAMLAAVLGAGAWSHHHPDKAAQSLETGRHAIGLATDLLGLRPLPDRPVHSLALAHRLAETTGWRAPRTALVERLSARLDPPAITAAATSPAATSGLARAVGALVTLRDTRLLGDQVTTATLFVTRVLIAHLTRLIQRESPLPVDAVGRSLELLAEVDPDAVRVLAPHVTDLLNERRSGLRTPGERDEFDQLARVLVARFPIVPPPVGAAAQPDPELGGPAIPDGR